MHCSKCFSSNIVIEEKENDINNSTTYIKCNDCGFEIYISEYIENFISTNDNFIITNYKLEKAEERDREEDSMLRIAEENRLNKIIEAKDKEHIELQQKYSTVLQKYGTVLREMSDFIDNLKEINKHKYIFVSSYKKILNKFIKDIDTILNESIDDMVKDL